MPHDLDQLFDRVELEAEEEPHSIPEGLKQAVLVGRAEQERESGNRQGHARPPALDDDPPLVQRQVQRRLKHFRELVSLVDEDDVFIARSQQQGVQVADVRRS